MAPDADQVRLLLAIAAVYQGKDRATAAQIGAMDQMDRQTLRDWVHRFNASGPDGMVGCKPPGVKRRLTIEQEAELAKLVEDGPKVETDVLSVGAVLICNSRSILARWKIYYHERTIGKILRRLGFRHLSARPRHLGQEPAEIARSKLLKNFSSRVGGITAKLAAQTPITI